MPLEKPRATSRSIQSHTLGWPNSSDIFFLYQPQAFCVAWSLSSLWQVSLPRRRQNYEASMLVRRASGLLAIIPSLHTTRVVHWRPPPREFPFARWPQCTQKHSPFQFSPCAAQISQHHHALQILFHGAGLTSFAGDPWLIAIQDYLSCPSSGQHCFSRFSLSWKSH